MATLVAYWPQILNYWKSWKYSLGRSFLLLKATLELLCSAEARKFEWYCSIDSTAFIYKKRVPKFHRFPICSRTRKSKKKKEIGGKAKYNYDSEITQLKTFPDVAKIFRLSGNKQKKEGSKTDKKWVSFSLFGWRRRYCFFLSLKVIFLLTNFVATRD